MKEEINKIQKKQIQELFDIINENKQIYYIDENMKEKLTEQITKIIRTELEELGSEVSEQVEIEVDFFEGEDANYSSNRRIDENGNLVKSPKITINLSHLNTRLSYRNVIDEVMPYCETLVKYIFHELQHLKQALKLEENESSKELITIAREEAIIKRAHNIYSDNYSNVAIENDAERAGYTRYMEIMGEDEEKKKGVAKNNMMYETGEYIIGKEKDQRDTMLDIIVDYLVSGREDKQLLKLYPPLLRIYHEDCTKKSASELVQDMENEKQEIGNDEKKLKDSREMYYELISNVLSKEDIKEIRKMYGNEYLRTKIIEDISKYFEQEQKRKFGIIKETQDICKDKNYGFERKIKKCKSYYSKKIDSLRSLDRNEAKNNFKEELKVNIELEKSIHKTKDRNKVKENMKER